MGYNIRITSEKEIDCIEDIIKRLPAFYKGPYPGKERQQWGWRLLTDVSISSDKKEIVISGAFSVSGKYAEGITLQIMNGLLKRGYIVYCESRDFNL